MKSTLITLRNGEVLTLSDVHLKTSIKKIILKKNFLELCEFVAQTYYPFEVDSESYRTIVNLLFLKSSRLRNIAAILDLSERCEIQTISTDFSIANFRDFFQNKDINFGAKSSDSINWINNNERLFSLLKWIANVLFSILSHFHKKQSKHEPKQVIRSWVDDVENIFKSEFPTSVIFIHPFLLNPIRGLKFIARSFQTYKNVRLVGIPYSSTNLLKILVTRGSKYDMNIVRFENEAMIEHSKAYEHFEIVYTSDEYLVSVHVLHSLLMSQRKIVINKAHGIGYYAPYVSYSEMHLYNNCQIAHYRLKNPNISYYNLPATLVSDYKFSPSKGSAVVFIDHGDLRQFNLICEDVLQEETILYLVDICKKHRLQFHIKCTPHRSPTQANSFVRRYGSVDECRDLAKLALRSNIVLVNLFSTAYYEFSQFGKILFVKNDAFDPTFMFGGDIECVELNGIEGKLVEYFSGS